MKKLLLVILFLCCASSVRAQAYITVSATKDCTADASTAINGAITTARQQGTSTTGPTGSVIYFPPGCYLINSTIVDSGATLTGYQPVNGISYEGLGRVELRAGSSLTTSIMSFGTDTSTASGRRISNIFFNCNGNSMDGIDLDGLVNSEFSNIEIRDCGKNAIHTTGSNPLNYSITFEGGLIGISMGVNLPGANGISMTNGSNGWTLKGTAITYGGSGTPTGIGLEFESSTGLTCVGCTIQGWAVGLWAGQTSTVAGLEFSGGYFEFNHTAGIILGDSALQVAQVHGASIHGVFLSMNLDHVHGAPPYGTAGIDIRKADGFHIFGNEFYRIGVSTPLPTSGYAVRGVADASSSGNYTGADNGIVGPNTIDSTSAPYSLQGSDTTLFAPACVSSASPANCSTNAGGTLALYTALGMVALPAGGNTLTVDAPFVNTTSQILINEDMTLGSKLGVTCNTAGGRTYSVTSKTPGTSFTITSSTMPSTNPACLVFHIQN